MPCSSLIDVSCLVGNAVGSAAASAGSGFLSDLAKSIQSSMGWIVTDTVALWVKVPSPYLTAQAPALTRIHLWLFPVTAAVAVGGAIAAGARMTLTRKHAPLLDLTTGLAVMGLAAALGLTLPTVLMKAGDLWSDWILAVSSGGNFGHRMTSLLFSGYGTGIPAMIAIIFGVIGITFNGIQIVLMLFRSAAVLVLAAVLPLAAAGAIAPATRTWIKKITSWMLALICYKPAAAAVYATAFTLIGSPTGLFAVLTGLVMLALSFFALPVLMKFFTWTAGSVGSSGGGSGQLFGAVASGALALGALRGGSSSPGGPAIQQADSMNASNPQALPGGPGSGGPSQPGAPGPSGGPGSPGSSGSPGDGRTVQATPTPPAPRSKDAPSGSAGSSQEREGRDSTAPARDSASTGKGKSSTLHGGTAGTEAPDGSGPSAGSGTATSAAFTSGHGSATAGQGGAAAAGSTAPWFAALVAAQSLATGAKNSAANAMDDGEPS